MTESGSREGTRVRRVAAVVCAWERVRAWLESQKLLAARGARAGLDPADFGGNGQILIRSIQ